MKPRYAEGLLTAALAGWLCTAAGAASDLNPKLWSAWPGLPTGWVGDVVTRGNLAFAIGSSGAGAHVLDVTDPAAPRAIGSTRLPLNGSTKFLGNHAYVAAGGSGLLILDMTDPMNPCRIGGVDTKGSASDVVVAGNYAFLVETTPDNRGLLQVIDIRDPAHAVVAGRHPLDARALSVKLSGKLLCVLGLPNLPDHGDQWSLDCFDIANPAQPQRVGGLQKPGYLVDSPGHGRLVVSGQYAYVSARHFDLNYASVEVVDLRDPANPQWFPGYKGNSGTYGLAVSGTNLFLAKTSLDGRGGLDVIDIATPPLLRKLATYYGEVGGVSISGPRAHIANNGRFEVLDINNPAAPRRVGSWTPPIGVMDLDRAGDLSYTVGPLGVTTYLNIVDTRNPAQPVPLGGLSVSGWTQRIRILGNYAYVVTETGLHAIDVSDPKAPRRTGVVTALQAFHDVAFAGDYAFVADQEAGLQLLTLTNRALPRRLATFLASSTDLVYGVCTASNRAFVLTRSYQGPSVSWTGQVIVLDISDPRNPSPLSTYLTEGVPVRAAVSGNLLCLVKRYVQDADRYLWGGMLEILDLTHPAAPQLTSQYEVPGQASDVHLVGDRAFVACNGPTGSPWTDWTSQGGLSVIDISDPLHPRRVGGSHRSPLTAVRVDADRADLGGGFYGTLQLLDLSPPGSPPQVARLDTQDLACGLAMDGSRLLVADRRGGVQVVDGTDPANPKWQSTIASVEPVWSAALSGGTAYLASGDAGVQVFDLTNPANPQPLAVYDTPGSARGVTLASHYAYVADGGAGLQILDITNPGSLQLAGSVATTGLANSVVLMGNLALVADWEDGLVIVDVTSPQNPNIVGNYNSGGYTLAVAVAGSHAILSDGSGGFQVLDLSTPATPKLVGSAPADGWARHIAVSGRFAYLADAFSGVQVYDISDPARPRRLGGTSAVDPFALAATATHLFAAGGTDGLVVLQRFSPPLDVTASPMQTAGSVTLRVDGPAGSSARLQRGTDLLQWLDWQTVTLGEAPLTVTDTLPTDTTRRFYRAVSP